MQRASAIVSGRAFRAAFATAIALTWVAMAFFALPLHAENRSASLAMSLIAFASSSVGSGSALAVTMLLLSALSGAAVIRERPGMAETAGFLVACAAVAAEAFVLVTRLRPHW